MSSEDHVWRVGDARSVMYGNGGRGQGNLMIVGVLMIHDLWSLCWSMCLCQFVDTELIIVSVLNVESVSITVSALICAICVSHCICADFVEILCVACRSFKIIQRYKICCLFMCLLVSRMEVIIQIIPEMWDLLFLCQCLCQCLCDGEGSKFRIFQKCAISRMSMCLVLNTFFLVQVNWFLAVRCFSDASCYQNGGRGVEIIVEHELLGACEDALMEELGTSEKVSYNNLDIYCESLQCECLKRTVGTNLHLFCKNANSVNVLRPERYDQFKSLTFVMIESRCVCSGYEQCMSCHPYFGGSSLWHSSCHFQ